ncbi:CSW phosphatase, partial [Pseudoatta argentina]
MERGIDSSFLARPSSSNPGDFTLSVRRNGEVTHIKIKNAGDFYDLYGGEKFATLSELVSFYMDNGGQLREKNGEIIELKHPLNCADPTTERWFHGHLSAKEAERLMLERGKNGSFLVRESQSKPGDFVLSVRTDDRVTHVMIRSQDKERSGAPKKFQDKELEQLLDEDPSQTLSELGKILQVDDEISPSLSSVRNKWFGNLSSTTILNDVQNKVNEMLSDTDIYEILKRDPCKYINEVQYRRLYCSDGLLSRADSPLYSLVSFLHNIMFEIIPKAESYIKNSLQLVKDLKGMKIDNNYKLILLDVVSFFTNIPLDMAIDCVNDNWKNVTQDGVPDGGSIYSRYSTYFTFNNHSSPLSSTIADLVMQKLERMFLLFYNNRNRELRSGLRQLKIKIIEHRYFSILEYYNVFNNKEGDETNTTVDSGGDDSSFGKCYIATQGCLPNTIQDFWHMVYQENTRVIVMTTKEIERGKNKCARYWPEEGESSEYGNEWKVRAVSRTSTADYTLREFFLQGTKPEFSESRRIYHYHFQAWPDHGVPSDPGCVLNFLHDVNARQESIAASLVPKDQDEPCIGPILVHCSAGIGRTGTFIVIDMILDQIKLHGLDCEIDIQRTVQRVRSRRSGMVQTEAQYKFVYLAVLHYIETVSQRMQAEQKSLQLGREYTNIRYKSETNSASTTAVVSETSTPTYTPTIPPTSQLSYGLRPK